MTFHAIVFVQGLKGVCNSLVPAFPYFVEIGIILLWFEVMYVCPYPALSLGIKLCVHIHRPQAVMATGQVLFHRFYCKKSFALFNVKVFYFIFFNQFRLTIA